MLQRTNGDNFYDNTHTVYSGSANDAALNARVQRFQAKPDAVEYVRRYTPTGKLSMPVMTLHTTQDPTVPFSQEAAYTAAVSQSGALPFLCPAIGGSIRTLQFKTRRNPEFVPGSGGMGKFRCQAE